jgi:hypothetical protein
MVVSSNPATLSPMKRRDRTKITTLMDGETDQTKVVFFPEDWRTTYSAYRAMYSGGLLHPERERASFREVVKHAALLGLWIGALAIFVSSQRSLIHHQPMNGQDVKVEARLSLPSKGTL